jgi:hypothetical protein
MVRTLGFVEGAGEGVRIHNGVVAVHADRGSVVVPLRFGVPNPAPLQPSIQQRPSDFDDSGRKEREDSIRPPH